MKYYEQLNNLETQLIRIDTISSLVSVITSGFENSANYEDIQNSLYLVEENLKLANQNIRRQFEELWEAIIDDDNQENIDIGNADTVSISSVKYDFSGLENTMHNWVKP